MSYSRHYQKSKTKSRTIYRIPRADAQDHETARRGRHHVHPTTRHGETGLNQFLLERHSLSPDLVGKVIMEVKKAELK